MSDNSPMNVLFDHNATRLEDWLTGKTSTFVIDPTANRLEAVPDEAVKQAIEECKRVVREAALVAHPECDDAIVDITGVERRPGWCHVDVNVRMIPPPHKVHLNVKITSSQEEWLKLSAIDEKRYREEYLGEVICK